MKIRTEEQDLLSEYLNELNMPLLDRLCVLEDLEEQEATIEMLQYISETKENDLMQLSKTASKISRSTETLRSRREIPVRCRAGRC